MRKSRFNDSQHHSISDSYLKGAKTVEALREEHQISPATFNMWKSEAETDKHEGRKRLKRLEAEHLRLKKMYAELQRKHEGMTDAVDSREHRGEAQRNGEKGMPEP